MVAAVISQLWTVLFQRSGIWRSINRKLRHSKWQPRSIEVCSKRFSVERCKRTSGQSRQVRNPSSGTVIEKVKDEAVLSVRSFPSCVDLVLTRTRRFSVVLHICSSRQKFLLYTKLSHDGRTSVGIGGVRDSHTNSAIRVAALLVVGNIILWPTIAKYML